MQFESISHVLLAILKLLQKPKPPHFPKRLTSYNSLILCHRLARMFSCRREFPGVATVHTAHNRLRALSSSSSDSGLGQSEKIYEFMETYYIGTYLCTMYM